MTKTSSKPMRRRRAAILLASVWFIAAAALGTRLAFTWYQQSQVPHQALATVPFDQEAGNTAWALAEGRGFSNLFRQETGPTAWLTPVYPFLLSLIFRMFGAFTLASFFAAAILNTLFSAAVTFPLYDLAKRVAGPGVAVAAGDWVFLPAGVLMPFEWIWDTSLSVLLATTLVWMTLRISESSKLKDWMWYALAWALALMTNPALGVALPFLFLWAAARAKGTAQVPWRTPAAAFALVILCCVPWTARNYAQFHRWIPLRSSLPFEFWIGNNDIFDEHAAGGRQRITRFEEARRYAELGETAYLDEKRNRANAFVSAKPGLFLRLTGRKIIATWAGTEHPFADFFRTESQLARAVIVCNLMLTLGTILAVVLLAKAKNPFTFPLAVSPALYPLIYYVTHTSLRYRHPIDPLLVLLTVIAAACLMARVRGKTLLEKTSI